MTLNTTLLKFKIMLTEVNIIRIDCINAKEVDRGIKGPPGVWGRFLFFIAFIEENDSNQELFSGRKNIVPSQSYRIFKSQKYIQLHRARKLQSRFPKNQL